MLIQEFQAKFASKKEESTLFQILRKVSHLDKWSAAEEELMWVEWVNGNPQAQKV